MDKSEESKLVEQVKNDFDGLIGILMDEKNDEACEIIIKTFENFFSLGGIPETDNFGNLLDAMLERNESEVILVKITALYCRYLANGTLTIHSPMLIDFLLMQLLPNPELNYTILFLFLKLLLGDEGVMVFILNRYLDELLEDIYRLLDTVFINGYYNVTDLRSCMDLIAVLLTKNDVAPSTCDFLEARGFLPNLSNLVSGEELCNICGTSIFYFSAYVLNNSTNDDVNAWLEPFFNGLIGAIVYFDLMKFSVKESFLTFVCSYLMSLDKPGDDIMNNLGRILTMFGEMIGNPRLEYFESIIPVLIKMKTQFGMNDELDVFPVYIETIVNLYEFIIDNYSDYSIDICLNFLEFVDDTKKPPEGQV